jgi:uncharacterized membrane protein
MMLRGYRKRLEADLTTWTAAGLIQPEQALGIRRAVQASAGGSRLPALLGLLGGLLLASSVLAFVAAKLGPGAPARQAVGHPDPDCCGLGDSAPL